MDAVCFKELKMAQVTIKSYRKEREKEITDGLLNGLKKAGFIVANQAKQNFYPRGSGQHPQVQTGRLWGSISVNWSKSGMNRGEVKSPAKLEDGVSQPLEELAVNIGTNVEYAKHLEFGTIKHPPYPFLFPAIEAKRSEIVEVLKGKEFIVT